MLSGKLSLLVLSFLLAVDAKRHHSLLSSSSSTGSGSGSSTTTSGSTSRSSSSSSSDGYAYYTASKSSSSSKSGSNSSSHRSSSSSDDEVQVLTRCRAKNKVNLVVEQPFGKKLGRILDFFEDKKVVASIVINGAHLLNSINYKSRGYAKIVRKAIKAGHDIIIRPHIQKAIKLMSEQEFLSAVQTSAIGFESATGTHPLMVHIPGGLPHDKRGKNIARLLKEYGYTIVHFSKTTRSHGKGLKNLKRRRSKKHSRRSSSSSSSSYTSSRSVSTSDRFNAISSTTSSSRSSSSSSSSSSRVCRKKRSHRHRRAKGHIIYAPEGKQIGRNIEMTLHNLRKKGYSFVNLKTCAHVDTVRKIHPEKYSHFNIVSVPRKAKA